MNYSISLSFSPIFTISITFPMQMDFNSPKFFHQTSYSPYSPKFLPPKFFIVRYNHSIDLNIWVSDLQLFTKVTIVDKEPIRNEWISSQVCLLLRILHGKTGSISLLIIKNTKWWALYKIMITDHHTGFVLSFLITIACWSINAWLISNYQYSPCTIISVLVCTVHLSYPFKYINKL